MKALDLFFVSTSEPMNWRKDPKHRVVTDFNQNNISMIEECI